MVALALLLLGSGAGFGADDGPDFRAGSLPDEGPRPVYSLDPADSWNRIFNALFTRRVRLRLAEEFAPGAPLERVKVAGFGDLPVSTERFERIEGGDRAIDPFDPFPVHIGSLGSPQAALVEPHHGRLKQALADALGEVSGRPPLARTLMQVDLWGAHDLLVAARPGDEVALGRKEELLGLLARSIKKLALTTREIEALPDNYAQAHLPFDPFAAEGGWVEVEYFPNRMHDSAADLRRATRVFLKPHGPTGDRDEWLNGLRGNDAHGIEKFDALALVVQLLVVDAEGMVVPTRLTYEAQVRTFPRAVDGKPSGTKLTVAELSRKALLLDHQAGGLVLLGEQSPAYLPRAGNDYFFPMSRAGRAEPVLGSLRRRCQSCHGKEIETVFTFSIHNPDRPAVRQLQKDDNEHARSVSRRKVQRADFQELKRRWDR